MDEVYGAQKGNWLQKNKEDFEELKPCQWVKEVMGLCTTKLACLWGM